jgi:Tfp pilus assembly protein PilX
MKKNFYTKKQSGFALLFTVLVITLILTITVGISSTTFKQGILSGLARDSQTALYQADRLLECALLYHTKTDGGMYDNTTFSCGGIVYTTATGGSTLYYTQNQTRTMSPCAVLRVIPKTATALNNTASLQVSGYNICQAHPRQVERTLSVTF